ncbi:MAG: hypothetical protein IJJ41_09345 [Clostridia bacterium]|nr:hypothetical protein [Clostridia bacterium]
MMKILELEYRFARSATTNPPVHEVKHMVVQTAAAGGVQLHHTLQGTWGNREQTVTLTAEQYETLCAFFESGEIRAQAAQPVPPINSMCVGGSTVECFCFCDESGRAETSLLSAQMRAVVQFLDSLVPAAGGAIPAGMAPAPTGAFVSPTALTPLQEGQWRCPLCGTANSGRFCTECGKQRSQTTE